MTHRLTLGLLAVLLSGCTSVIRATDVRVERPVRVPTSAPIVTNPPSLALLPGTVIGGQAVNPDRPYTSVFELGDSFKVDPADFVQPQRDELRNLGYQVATGSTGTAFTLQPVVTRMVYNVFGSDPNVGWTEAELAVRWTVQGTTPFTAETRGSAVSQQHSRVSVLQAYRIALRNFLANPQFAAMVTTGAAPAPQPAYVAPQPAVTPQPVVIAPQPPIVTPQPAVVTPQPVFVAPQPPVVAPKPAVVAPVVVPAAAMAPDEPAGVVPAQRLKRPAESAKVLDPTAVAQRARPSVLTVMAGDAWGSGVAVAPELVLTQASLVRSGSVAVVSASGKQSAATVLRVDPTTDLALLSVKGAALEPAPVNLAPASTGDAVVALGTPYHPALSFSMSPGVLTTVVGTRLGSTAKVSAGNGGGPVVDDRGRVAGIVMWDTANGGESTSATCVSGAAAFKALGLGYADLVR